MCDPIVLKEVGDVLRACSPMHLSFYASVPLLELLRQEGALLGPNYWQQVRLVVLVKELLRSWICFAGKDRGKLNIGHYVLSRSV